MILKMLYPTKLSHTYYGSCKNYKPKSVMYYDIWLQFYNLLTNLHKEHPVCVYTSFACHCTAKIQQISVVIYLFHGT